MPIQRISGDTESSWIDNIIKDPNGKAKVFPSQSWKKRFQDIAIVIQNPTHLKLHLKKKALRPGKL